MSDVDGLVAAREKVWSALVNLEGAHRAMGRIASSGEYDLCMTEVSCEFGDAWNSIVAAIAHAADLDFLIGRELTCS